MQTCFLADASFLQASLDDILLAPLRSLGLFLSGQYLSLGMNSYSTDPTMVMLYISRHIFIEQVTTNAVLKTFQERRFVADRIHSHRDRNGARRVAIPWEVIYQDGQAKDYFVGFISSSSMMLAYYKYRKSDNKRCIYFSNLK